MTYKILFVLGAQLMLLTALHAQTNVTSNLKGEYLGQGPPGMTAVLFAKGIVSTDSIEHSAPAFSPDGNRVLWTKIYKGKPTFLVEMRKENRRWTAPSKPSFASP